MSITIDQWYKMTIGKSYNTDGAYGYQCWDYFDYFKKYNGLAGLSTYCALTGYAGDIWKLRHTNGADKYFEFLTPDKLVNGCWVFWEKHVAFLYNGKEVGQNQIAPRNTVTAMTLNRKGILGGFLWKEWAKDEKGVAEKYNAAYGGNYTTTADLNIRSGGNTNYKSYGIIKKGDNFRCYGYYHENTHNDIWLYGQATVNNIPVTGFVSKKYLQKR